MNNRKKVSIIVPIYNAEEFLDECITSILNQTLDDIEIILINDGSTDNSHEICKKYVNIDSKLIYISKNNEGISKTRKLGVEMATGLYIGFVDSDDYIEPNMFEIMFNNAVSKNYDLVECAEYILRNNSKNALYIYDCDHDIHDKKDFIDKIFMSQIVIGENASVMWNKLYKAEIAKKVSEYGENLLEDYLFNLQYYSHVKSYKYIKIPLYSYRVLEKSLSRSYNDKSFFILNNVNKFKKDIIYKLDLININDCISKSNKWYLNYVESIIYLLFLYKGSDYSLITKIKKSMEILKTNEVNDAASNIINSNFNKNDLFINAITRENYISFLTYIYFKAKLARIRNAVYKFM